jgi:hypothetical protein
MSDIMMRTPRRVSLAIAAPVPVLAYKMYLLAALVGTDLYAPADTISFLFGSWPVRCGDIIDVIATATIFIELMKATRIDLSGQINFGLSVLVVIGAIVMMWLVPATINIFTVKLMAMSLACLVVSAVLRVSIARRDFTIGN